MIISVNWLKKFTDIDVSIEKLTELIGARLVEIEGVQDLGEKYKDVIIANVVECRPVEDSDHLNLTKIDDGGAAPSVERDENGLVQVVCGAPNVKAGMLVAWLPPESIVPETFGDAEPFILGARSLRGYMSNGMIASAKELDLYDEHSGILVIDQDAAPGTNFADLYELNDYLLDIENKSLTHRPDTFGIVGFAREISGIQGKSFTTPKWLEQLETTLSLKKKLPLTATIADPALSARYQAVVLSDATEATQSPVQLQTYLARSGVRPINAIVDVTNYMMLVTGQPLHAFDYDKVVKVGDSADITVRTGKKNETLKLLDGRTIKLDPTDIVIAAGDTAIGLAGAMGGADTEIDASTKNIILESATFNLYNLRTTQMRHGIFSEAITRFTKGQPAPMTAPVLQESVRMLQELTHVTVASEVVDTYPGEATAPAIELNETRINGTLGTQFAAEDVHGILENVGFTVVSGKSQTITVTPPYWRNDIHIAEDVMEELGRIAGFDTIPVTLPRRDFTAVRPTYFDQLRANIRSLLVRAGANEVLTYSFVHGDMMKKAGQNPEQAYKIVNSISPELQYYRQSLLPSLLSNVHPNAKLGYDTFALFELNKFHTKIHEPTKEGVPLELDSLGFIVSSTKKGAGAAYYQAKHYLDYLASELGIELIYEPLEAESTYPVTQPFEPKRSARVWEASTRERVGVIGEFKKSVQKNFKLPEATAGFELSSRALAVHTENLEPTYRPLSKYPGTERDICFKVAQTVTYQTIVDATRQSLAEFTLISSVNPVDVYQPEKGDTKNITVRIALGSYEKTLSGEEVNGIMKQVIKDVTTATGGTVV